MKLNLHTTLISRIKALSSHVVLYLTQYTAGMTVCISAVVLNSNECYGYDAKPSDDETPVQKP